MKLLYCTKCQDVVRLIEHKVRQCECGSVKGKGLGDNLNCVYSGDTAIPIGIGNKSLILQVIDHIKTGSGNDINAFIIRKDCLTFKKVSSL